MQHRNATVERVISRIASSQHGVVSRAQLLGAGISPEAIRRRLLNGGLIRSYPGVYRVGHYAHSVEADYMAAVLACSDGTVLGDRAAAHHLKLIRSQPPTPEVITPGRSRPHGVATRRTRGIDSRDMTICRSIPVTTVPRTLVDLASLLSEDALARAVHEADVRYRLTPDQIEAVLARRPTSPGARRLRRVIHGDVHVTLSKLESAFPLLLRRESLPLPQTNVVASTRRVDCRWPGHRLTVELDSYRFHRSRHSWEQDRRREREARARGDEFRRYTYADVLEDSTCMLAELRALLLERVALVL